MSLFNKKANQDDQIDRISELPDNVIDGILEKLNIRDLVRTSILSTKWRYMWTSVPRLEFGDYFFEMYEYRDEPAPSPVVSKIITDVLMLHNGPIHKFLLFIPYEFSFEITLEYLNTWIPFLSRDIKHLELVNLGTHLDQMPYVVFSCQELNYFKFGGFNFSTPPNFRSFKRLLDLEFYDVTFESGALENLISGCPLLENLSITYCDGFEYFHISAPSLKVLLLDSNEDMKSICLKKAKKLIDLTINTDNSKISGLIKSLPKIRRFTITRYFGVKEITYADIIPPTLLMSSFSSLEYLDLDQVDLNERGELLHIVSVLKSAPSLVELVIKSCNYVDTPQVSDHSDKLECSSCCLKLQTVKIFVRSSSQSQHAMSLIQFILASSTSLEILTFRVGLDSKKLDAPTLLRISQDLLWMERASQRAHVKFLHGDLRQNIRGVASLWEE